MVRSWVRQRRYKWKIVGQDLGYITEVTLKCYVDVTVFQMEGEELGLKYGIDNTTKGTIEGY